MKDLILTALFIGRLQITAYRPVRSQTDATPFNTSTTEHVRAGGCAVSRDLLCPACRRLHHRCSHPENLNWLHYGDWIYIEKYKYRQVNDIMGKYVHYRVAAKHHHAVLFKHQFHAVDILVERWSEEHAVQVQHLNVFKIQEDYYEKAR